MGRCALFPKLQINFSNIHSMRCNKDIRRFVYKTPKETDPVLLETVFDVISADLSDSTK